MNETIRIEKLITSKKTICTMEAQNGSDFVSKKLSNAEAWNMEILCANAGYKSRVLNNEIVYDAIHTTIVWER